MSVGYIIDPHTPCSTAVEYYFQRNTMCSRYAVWINHTGAIYS